VEAVLVALLIAAHVGSPLAQQSSEFAECFVRLCLESCRHPHVWSVIKAFVRKDEAKAAVEGRKSSEAVAEDKNKQDDQNKEREAAPDSPSKQLPDQISFFSGNPSVEIVHGIMHLYKTK